jgi:DNA-binding FadR family transcriptional regulator
MIDDNWEYSYALEGITVQMRANRYHPLQFEISDLEFHLKTIDIFNNKRIHKFTRAIRVELIRIGFLSQTSPEDNDLVVDQLMQLVLAIREKRLNDALEVLKDHLDSGRNLALDKLKLNKLARPDKEHIEKEPEPSMTA